MTIRRLSPNDAEAYRTLRLLGLRESPGAFGRSHREESPWPLSVFEERLSADGAAASFGAVEGDRLVGIVTLLRSVGLKERHKAAIVGLYVHPDFRRRGVAGRLLVRVLRHASTLPGLRQLRVAVVEGNGPALALYQASGFSPYGREPQALCEGRRYLDEFLLARAVPRRTGG